MKDQLQRLGGRLWNDFKAFSPGQKAVTIAAALALIVGGYLFTTWKSKPSYAPLYTNLSATDASAMVDKLNSAHIPYQLGNSGTEILVPQSKVYSTRLTMSAAGLPSSSQTGFDLLDKEGVTTSQFQQQVDYQRALQTELGATIESINGITAASVNLAIPQQDVFNDGSQKPTAAVMLTTSSGTQLTTQQVQSIVYLVSSSVPQMSPDSVTVTDSAGQVLSAPGSGVTDAAATSTQDQATQDYDNQLSTKLESLINATLGTGHAVVTVNSVLDFDQTKTETNTYVNDPSNPPLSEQEDKETYGSGGTGAGGTLGAGQPATDTTTSNGTSGPYKKSSKVVNNALGTKKQTIVNAPGSVKKLSIAVLLDGTPKTVDVSGIQTLVQSAVGFDSTRGDTLSVQAMPFSNAAAKAAQKAQSAAAKAAAAKAAHAHLMSMVKQGVLVAVILAVILGTWLASRRRKGGGDPEPQADFGLFPEPDEPVLPETVLEPAVPSTDANEAVARRRALFAIADEQPDDVARVLSGCLRREG